MRLRSCILIVALSATAASAQPRKLDMVAFFTGRTHAENVLKIVLKRPARLVADSVGARNRNGEFVLTETIREEGKPARERKWVMRPAGPNRYTGSLSDAVGPVDITVAGDTATVRYTMKGGLRVDQRMRLLADGRTLSNDVVVKKLGMKFARVEGRIRKLD